MLTVKTLDMNAGSFQEVMDRLVQTAPDFIGISLRNVDNVDAVNERCFIDQYATLMRAIRERLTVPIILGGAGFSIFPTLLCEVLQPDFAITGEGEARLATLLQCLMDGREPASMPGLYRRGRWDRVDARIEYVRRPSLAFETTLAARYWQQSGMLSVQTKRGCPYECVYCTYPLIDGRQVRTLDIDNILATLREMQERHGANYVFFTDSVFNIKPDFNRRLAQALVDAKLGVKWGAYFSPWRCSQEDLALFKASGLSHVEFGTESLCDTTLERYGKPFRMQDVFRAADACRALEIDHAHFLIFGGPGETEATVEQTFVNAERLPPTVLFPFVGMRIYPGTPLQAQAIAEGVITAEDDLLRPAFYTAAGVNLSGLKARAATSARRWVFSDEDHAEAMLKIRQRKHRSGPLWELLVR